jgi:hypothetical protein
MLWDASCDRIKHTEYDGGATKAEEVERGLQQAQEAALDETHGGCNWQSGRWGVSKW